MSEAEISVWAAHRQRKGLPVERLANGVAAAGAYIGSGLGGKAKPGDLMPRFRTAATTAADLAAVKAWFGRRAIEGA